MHPALDFQSECGSPIAHAPDADKSIIALKGGCFDRETKKTFKPSIEIYTQVSHIGSLSLRRKH